ncbi:MAG: NSS family neurotransmitter:Na+ symporter [Oceanicoccus sp.]|jgi:NSS family neurotransmitter:Na+ symporter
MSQFHQVKRQGWHRSWSFIAATTGATIGLGNLWKFSYLAGENGGGAFVLAYILCIFLVAMPVMIAEAVLGSRGRANPVTAVQDVSLEAGRSAWWQVIGWLGIVAGLLVLSYYAVIAGWSMAYIGKLLLGGFVAASPQLAGESFSQLLESPVQQMQWHIIFLLLVLVVVAAGVRRGIALSTRIFLPLLFIALVALAIYSNRVGDAEAAWSFLMQPDFSALSKDVWLQALGHAFFSLSIGTGVIIAYGAYAPDKRPISTMICTVAVMDTVVSLLAGLAIFPLVFSLNMAPAMGPGLMFVAMPYGFGNMIYGNYFGALFFLMVSIAALMSAVAMLEPATVWLAERFRWWRPAAATLVLIPVWLMGLATIFSFNIWQHVEVAGMSLFAALNFITANILLPLGGLLTAIFVGWRMRREVLRDELYVEGERIFRLWYWLLRYIAGPGVLLVFVWSLWLWSQ